MCNYSTMKNCDNVENFKKFKTILKSDDVSTFAQRHYQVSDERNENEYKCQRIP